MGKPEETDEVTGLSLADLEAAAEDLYDHRAQAIGDEVPAEHASEIRSVVSVRFGRAELDDIAAAAQAAGQPLSTYIRNAALAAAVTIDLAAARRELHAVTQALGKLGRSLGSAA